MDMINKVENLEKTAKRDKINNIVVGIFVKNENYVLVLQRHEDDSYPNMYEVPGGGVEKNESILEAISRELDEETGMKVNNVISYLNSFDYETSSGVTRQLNFLVDTADLKVKRHPEHQNFKWIQLSELNDIPMTKEMHKSIKETFIIMR